MVAAAAPVARQAWTLAREGRFREATALAAAHRPRAARDRLELRLVAAMSAMRQGRFDEAREALDAATRELPAGTAGARLGLRIRTWEAELAYFQGRYSAATAIVEEVIDRLESARDAGYAAFALRIRMAILLAGGDYAAIEALRERALRLASASGDAYVEVQVLNVLGATAFDRATSRLDSPHARAHLPSLDRADIAPLKAEAQAALEWFLRAKGRAEEGGLHYAAWYVAGNIERLEILVGRPERAARLIRRRLNALQAAGATYDEIAARSNLAWALRLLGRDAEALLEIDAALALARGSGTYNVLLEFLHYDRSVVLEALGERAAAAAAYRRYLRLNASRPAAPGAARAPRALEPHVLKRADRFIASRLRDPWPVAALAEHCGVSWRTLEKTFVRFRGITPVAHVRNLRLDGARAALEAATPVAEAARRFGFRSTTTFALEFRKRFGVAPRDVRKRGEAA